MNSQLENLACKTRGFVIESIDDSEYYVNVMMPYLEYLTQGVYINKPIWSTIYEDAFGFG